VTGTLLGPHWGGETPEADFFDARADVEAMMALWRTGHRFKFDPAANPALTPGRSAAISRAGTQLGWIGELHPGLQQKLELRHPVMLFELDLTLAGTAGTPKYAPFSRFPAVHRDLAVVVDESVSVAQLTERVAGVLGDSLRRCEIFDIYRGPGVDSGRKSVGMGLILQDASRTLNDEETDDMMRRVMRHLEHELEATIRS
jgi:phenylalanyl-tRNA synthetase beta chain